MRRIAQFALLIRANLLRFSGVVWYAKRRLRDSGSVIVLTLHRVLGPADAAATGSLEGIIVSEQSFRILCKLLTSSEYSVVPVHNAAAGRPTGKLKVAITFDDGWNDNYTTALPVLKEYKIPAVVFVCPGLAGQQLPFWPERMVKLLRGQTPRKSEVEIAAQVEHWKFQPEPQRDAYLIQLAESCPEPLPGIATDALITWPETAAMASQGIEFGSHTHSHQILTMIPIERVATELNQSKADMEAALGLNCDTLAYPNGNYSAEIRNCAEAAGYRLAFTTIRGGWTEETDPLAIPRANIYGGNMEGPLGGFSKTVFEYTTIWKSWRALSNAPTTVSKPVRLPVPQEQKEPAS
jgi:peptidoglycan/xylan/chitin deacetylase (PgdA/CDA1 family)